MKKRTIHYLIILLFPLSLYAYNDTPNYYKCTNRNGGSWTFGRAPNVCDTYHFLDTQFVERNFSEATFFDPVDQTAERRRYMTEMHALLKATASYFIRMKKPSVTDREHNEFLHAVFAIANQESYWSHYRQVQSGNTQFMRGDYGHGHGMMQVDDRWHFDAITSGKGAHLIHNIIYSLDEYYRAWQKALSSTCVNSSEDWVARSRSAYSAYNGGPSRICRWTNPNDKWARNDQGFYTKYLDQKWMNYVDDPDQASSVDVECSANGGEDCRSGAQEPGLPKEKRYYKLTSNHVCLYEQDQFHCVEDAKDKACLSLKLYQSYQVSSDKVFDFTEDVSDKEVYSRHDICKSVPGVVSVTKKIQVQKNINLRLTPGGKLLSTTKSGSVYQVLDFEVVADASLKRYYKLKHDNSIGWIYAGDISSHADWSKETTKAPEQPVFAEEGDKVSLKEDLSFYDSQFEKVFTVNQESVVEVNGHFVKSLNNQLYYQVIIDGVEGYLFVGTLVPELEIYDNLETYIGSPEESPIEESPAPIEEEPLFAQVSGWYRSLRSCASSSCNRVKFIWRGNTVKVLNKTGNWYLVEYNGFEGYLRNKDIKL